MNAINKVLIFLLAGSFICYAGNGQRRFSFTLKENYTSSSRLYLSPNSDSPAERNNSNEMDHIYSPAFEFRYLISEQMSLGVNLEYLSKTRKGIYVNMIENRSIVSVEVEDGYKIVPIELSLYYHLPFSSDKVKVSIYGGGAFYIGNHVRKLGDLSVSNQSRKLAYGIQVGISFDYVVNRFFSLTSDLKFRDPEVNLVTTYDSNTIHYGSRTLLTVRDTFDSKINIDGITYSFGIKISI